MPFTALQISQLTTGRLIGNSQVVVTDAKPVEQASSNDLTFASDRQRLKQVLAHQPAVALIHETLVRFLPAESPVTFIVVESPLEATLDVLQQLRPERQTRPVGISPNAFVSASAHIGVHTSVHAGAHIDEDVKIGDRCTIHPGVVIGGGSRIGNNVELHAYVVIYPEVEIGNNVTIHASSILGAAGFGYRTVNGRHQRLRHFGTVRIEDDVEIGAAATIDRGMIGATTISEGSKIDNMVVVAHNCHVGRHNLLVAQVGLAGSVTTGDYAVCAGQVGVADHVHIGDHSILAAKTGVPKDVPENRTYFGIPAALIEEATQQMMAVRRLPALRQQIRKLESRVGEISDRLETFIADTTTSDHDSALT